MPAAEFIGSHFARRVRVHDSFHGTAFPRYVFERPFNTTGESSKVSSRLDNITNPFASQ
jgi:hypothetical protein